MGPPNQFLPIRSKLSKPFCRQPTHYATELLHGWLSNIISYQLVVENQINNVLCYMLFGSALIKMNNHFTITMEQSFLSVLTPTLIVKKVVTFSEH